MAKQRPIPVFALDASWSEEESAPLLQMARDENALVVLRSENRPIALVHASDWDEEDIGAWESLRALKGWERHLPMSQPWSADVFDVPASDRARAAVHAWASADRSSPDESALDDADAEVPVYGVVKAPRSAELGTAVDVSVLLSRQARPGAAVLELELGATLDVHLVLTGCELVNPKEHDFQLDLESFEKLPERVVKVQSSIEGTSSIQAFFSQHATLVGVAVATLVWSREHVVPVVVEESVQLGRAISVVDLTATVVQQGDELLWTCLWFDQGKSQTVDVRVPFDRTVQPTSFFDTLAALMRLEDAEERKSGLIGFGQQLGAFVPEPLWSLVSTLETQREDPRVLLGLSGVLNAFPFELAVDPADGSSLPLGARCALSRWPVFPQKTATTFPPLATLELNTENRAGVYYCSTFASGYRELPFAKIEAEAVAKSLQTNELLLEKNALRDVLRSPDRPKILHVATHALMLPADPANSGIVCHNEDLLGILVLRGLRSTSAGFVFLNACQASQAQTTFGSPDGLALSFLANHSLGVLAPIWWINDEEASEIAKRLYEELVGNPQFRLAKYIAQLKREWFADPTLPSTVLAYQFWGHPSFSFVGTWGL